MTQTNWPPVPGIWLRGRSVAALPRGGGVLDNIRGICAPNALVASRKLLPVLTEVVGVKFPFVVLM